MVIEIHDCYDALNNLIKDNPDIAEKYQIKKIRERYGNEIYEFSCDKVEDLFSFLRIIKERDGIAKSEEQDLKAIIDIYGKSIELFYGYLDKV